MPSKIKTYMVNGLNPSKTITSTFLSGYKGCFYYISGAGGNNSSIGSLDYGGPAGYVNSGYIDFEYPYNVNEVKLDCNLNGETTLSIGFTGPYLDPSLGTDYAVIKADAGSNYLDSNFTESSSQASSNVIRSSYNIGALKYNAVYNDTIDQRGNVYSGTGASGYNSNGNLTSDYGQTVGSDLGGAGFYGNYGITGGYGYSSGYYSTPNYGYGVVSLIPSDNIVSSNFIIDTTQTTGLTGNSTTILYNLLGGGGGGGKFDNGTSDNAGAGGGGSGDWLCGLLKLPTGTVLNINVGAGGTGATGPAGNTGFIGDTGGNTTLTYNNTTITAIGGEGGGYESVNLTVPSSTYFANGAGGAGYYGGGGGSYGKGSWTGIYSYGSVSYTKIPSYNGQQGNARAGLADNYSGGGGGSVNYSKFGAPAEDSGDRTLGGGGGGFWGGGGEYNGTGLPQPGRGSSIDGVGYGCGGGGSKTSGGTGYQGYAIIHYLKDTNENFTINNIFSNTIFTINEYRNSVGFWFFLSEKNYYNSGHFLIKEDGVQSISFNINTVSSTSVIKTITITFNASINGKQQVFTLSSDTPQKYATIMFYS